VGTGQWVFAFEFPLRLCAFARERFLPEAKGMSLEEAQRRKGKSKP
jgi:hypothetical protein